MPKKESGAQRRKRRAQFEAFLNESIMKTNFKSSGYAKRQSADIRRQDESAGTDNHRIVKHRGHKIFVCPGAQDPLATPLTYQRFLLKYNSVDQALILCEVGRYRRFSTNVVKPFESYYMNSVKGN